jgi:hypothetical protein
MSGGAGWEDIRHERDKRVLLLGVIAAVIEDVQQHLQMPEIELIGGTSVVVWRSDLGRGSCLTPMTS